MTTQNQLLGRNAAPYVIEHDGQRYEFRAMAQAEKSAFRAWLIGRVRETLCLLYAGEDLSRELRTLTADAVAGLYDFGGEIAAATMGTPEGVVRLASILAGCEPDDVLTLWVARPDEVKQALDLVVAESMRRHGFAPNGRGVTDDRQTDVERAKANGEGEPARPFPPVTAP